MDTKEHDELKLLYHVSVQDLAFFKRQQWVVTNYGIALYVAIVGIAQLLASKSVIISQCTVFWVAAVLVLIVWLACSLVVCMLWQSLRVRRARLGVIRNRFTHSFAIAWSAKKKSNDDAFVPFLLLSVLVVGAGLAEVLLVWLMY